MRVKAGVIVIDVILIRDLQHHLVDHIVNRLNLQATPIGDVAVVLIIDLHQRFEQLHVYLIAILDVEVARAESVRFVILFWVVLVIIQEFSH